MNFDDDVSKNVGPNTLVRLFSAHTGDFLPILPSIDAVLLRTHAAVCRQATDDPTQSVLPPAFVGCVNKHYRQEFSYSLRPEATQVTLSGPCFSRSFRVTRDLTGARNSCRKRR